MPNELITGIIKLLFFFSYLMIVGLTYVDYQNEKKVEQRSYSLLYFSIFINWLIVLLDTQNYHITNYFITIIFILNLIFFVNSLESFKLAMVFNINLIGSIVFLEIFGHNPVINTFVIVLALIVHCISKYTLKTVQVNSFEYIFHGIILCLTVGVYIINVYKDIYYFMYFFLACCITVLIYFISHKIIFYHNNQLSEFFRESIYDFDSKTFNLNYLHLKIAELNEHKQTYHTYFIDIYYPKYNVWYEDTMEDNQVIHEMTKIIKGSISEQDLLGRINLKRFCLVLTSNEETKIKQIQNQIDQLNAKHDYVSFYIVKEEKNTIFVKNQSLNSLELEN